MGGNDGGARYVSVRAAMLSAMAALLPLAATAGEDARKVDAELLEFLGSIDAEDEGWQDYLEQKPVKPAKAPAKKQAPAPEKPDPKQVKPG